MDGNHFSYTIDVSQVGCNCLSRAFFSQMGYYPGNTGEYYCDAWGGNGVYCPTYEAWQGNKHSMAVTLHICDGDGEWWNYCDLGGCLTNAYNVNDNLMCPEDHCTINTNQPFTVSHYQDSEVVNVWFEQEGRTATFDASCNDDGQYISRFAPALNEMVFVADLWSPTNSFIDNMTGCKGECNLEETTFTLSNIHIWA